MTVSRKSEVTVAGGFVIGHITAETVKGVTTYYGSHQGHECGWSKDRDKVELAIRKAHDRLIAKNFPSEKSR